MNTPASAAVELRKVDTGRGWSWLTEAWELFMRAPGTWIAIIVIYILILTAASIVHGGSLLTTLFEQVFSGGLILACKTQDSGEKLKIEQLFAGFSGSRFGKLVLLGVLNMAALFALTLLGLLLAVACAALAPSDFTAMDVVSPDSVVQRLMPQMLDNLPLLLVALILLSLYIPLLMGMWLAPALIVLRGQQPIAAFRLSFRACVVNFMPFLIYGLVGLLIAVVATIPLGLGWLLAAPVFSISIYTSYRDMFPQAPDFSATQPIPPPLV